MAKTKFQTFPEGKELPKAKQSLGQNFLVNKDIVRKILASSGVKSGDIIIELGLGLGALTYELAKVASQIIGIEIDQRLIDWLTEYGNLPSNVSLQHGDMLTVSFKEFSERFQRPLRILGNLPYNISSQILIKLIHERDHIEWATLMFQKEVADRLLAHPGSKKYGILTVLINYCATVKRLFDISPNQFRPRPKISSTVIKIKFTPPSYPTTDFDFFNALVRKAFQQRRKKIVNSIKGFYNFTPNQLHYALSQCNIPASHRAEHLTGRDYVNLANLLFEIKEKIIDNPDNGRILDQMR